MVDLALPGHNDFRAMWWEAGRLGRMIVSSRGEIFETNERARKLLKEGDAVFEREQVLACRMRADEALIARALRRYWRAPSLFVARSEHASEPVLLEILSLSETSMRGMPPSLAAVTVWRARIKSPVRAKHLAAMFELTNTEQKIVALLILGKRNEEIGSVCGITAQTVRTHTRNVYRKLNLNSRSDLLRLVMQYSS